VAGAGAAHPSHGDAAAPIVQRGASDGRQRSRGGTSAVTGMAQHGRTTSSTVERSPSTRLKQGQRHRQRRQGPWKQPKEALPRGISLAI